MAGLVEAEPVGLKTVVPARVRAAPAVVLPEGTLPQGLDAAPFVFEAEISNSDLDAYYTHMADSTLRNFASAAARGVSLLDSHDAYKLPIGYSAGGRYEEEDGRGRVVATFYILPGIRLGGQHSYATSDDYIAAIRGGIVRDMSVGFYGGEHICDLCGQPYFGQGSTCNHIAGWRYNVEIDGRMTSEVCTVAVHEGDLSETSLVYDGATPGAMILKAEQESAAGRLSPEAVTRLERQYRVRLPRPTAWAAVTTNTTHNLIVSANLAPKSAAIDAAASSDTPASRGQGVAMHKDEEVTVEAPAETPAAKPAATPEGVEPVADENRAALDDVRRAVLETAAPQGVALTEAVRWLNGQLSETRAALEGARAEVARLQPLADQGRAYREELINQAIAEGVRAMGEAFPEETYRAMLKDAPLEHVRQVRDTFEAQAALRFPGGRQTQDEPAVNDNKPQRETPLAAYGVS